MNAIDYRTLRKEIAVYDWVDKYGDWLFKQPLLIGLKKEGWRIHIRRSSYPALVESYALQDVKWALVFTQRDLKREDPSLTAQFKTLIEIQRISRFTELVKLWRRGICVRRKTFRYMHEQERVHAIARYLNLRYEERSVKVVRPKRRLVSISMNVRDRESDRLNFDFHEINKVVRGLRACGYSFLVLRPRKEINVPQDFFSQFQRREIIWTRSFEEACHVVDKCDFYFGADSGLSHYAVRQGKITCALYSLRYHGRQPLFQSTFQNHLCYFGDSSFRGLLLSDLKRLERKEADDELVAQINLFLREGKGVNSDPYSNERKIFALRTAFVSQTPYCVGLARAIHAHSAGIFFVDEVMEVDISTLKPFSGKLFIDTKVCAKKLQKLIAAQSGSERIDLYAKSCSFFYGTAMGDGSSDLDLPTLHIRGRTRRIKSLLMGIKKVLDESGLITELPHQTPVLSRDKYAMRSLRPIVLGGRLAYVPCVQNDEDNLQKYEARVKLKIILGEMTKLERGKLEKLLGVNENGKRLLREIEYLEKDTRYFGEWSSFIRKISCATSMLGDFGSKGHLFLKVRKSDCSAVSATIGGLIRHGVVYAVGLHLYPIWNIRRPQHGWFQPITVFAEDTKMFQRGIARASRSPLYSSAPLSVLKLLSSNKIRTSTVFSLLESPNPLLFMEAYRYVSRHARDFVRSGKFSRRELRAYAREKESNCNNPRDRKLSLWSLATGLPLPLLPKDINQLTRYNCFVHLFTTGSAFDISSTSFFKVTHHVDASARDFTKSFSERMILLLREYYLYTLATGLPGEFLHEKTKEILFIYCVQGRVLLEGPRVQVARAARFLRKLNISTVFSDERILHETILNHPLNLSLRSKTEFLFSWLISHAKSEK